MAKKDKEKPQVAVDQRTRGRRSPIVTLPEGTLSFEKELVPAVRLLLARGLAESFQRTCVRIESFDTYSGGLKSPLVGGFRINVDAALKLGSDELKLHAALMRHVNQKKPRTFVDILDVVQLDKSRWLLLMGQLANHTTLFDMVYKGGATHGDLHRSLDKTLEALAVIHSVGRDSSKPLRTALRHTIDPYTPRIRPKLMDRLRADPGLSCMLHEPGRVQGKPCPALAQVLDELEKWLKKTMPGVAATLVHGDLHLRNAMVRWYGRGVGVRLIDPNPEAGFTDPVYDYGKLLHFAEPVGWALASENVCHATFKHGAGRWALDAQLRGAPASAVRRQQLVEKQLRERADIPARAAPDSLSGSWNARLMVSRASAHLGLLARFPPESSPQAGRFVLAHALAALADWRASALRTS